uniref:Endonuclease/exonuclease/phosphatase domain-containing protein n=1 Tax=Chenopodium quinoa TaxID=63459 RepID=A0A803LTV6_CHEQI
MPQSRETYVLSAKPSKIVCASFANALVILETHMEFKQLEIKAQFLYDVDLDVDLMEAEFTPLTSRLHSRTLWKFVEIGASAPQEVRREFFKDKSIPEPLIIVAWNARGIARDGFQTNIHHIITEHQPDLLFLSEIKTSRAHTEHIIKGLPYDSYELAEPRGFSGGVLLLWNRKVLHFQSLSRDIHAIHGIVKVIDSNLSFYISAFMLVLDIGKDLQCGRKL